MRIDIRLGFIKDAIFNFAFYAQKDVCYNLALKWMEGPIDA